LPIQFISTADIQLDDVHEVEQCVEYCCDVARDAMKDLLSVMNLVSELVYESDGQMIAAIDQCVGHHHIDCSAAFHDDHFNEPMEFQAHARC
jgi:hypothetical protein